MDLTLIGKLQFLPEFIYVYYNEKRNSRQLILTL